MKKNILLLIIVFSFNINKGSHNSNPSITANLSNLLQLQKKSNKTKQFDEKNNELIKNELINCILKLEYLKNLAKRFNKKDSDVCLREYENLLKLINDATKVNNTTALTNNLNITKQDLKKFKINFDYSTQVQYFPYLTKNYLSFKMYEINAYKTLTNR